MCTEKGLSKRGGPERLINLPKITQAAGGSKDHNLSLLTPSVVTLQHVPFRVRNPRLLNLSSRISLRPSQGMEMLIFRVRFYRNALEKWILMKNSQLPHL